jgi:hypothetical protein
LPPALCAIGIALSACTSILFGAAWSDEIKADAAWATAPWPEIKDTRDSRWSAAITVGDAVVGQRLQVYKHTDAALHIDSEGTYALVIEDNRTAEEPEYQYYHDTRFFWNGAGKLKGVQ